ncbi:MAG TPA: LysE family transporter [Polyangiaceae bacterium]|jgi:threonine/homoserine/homoserine lactone efflux protein
MIVAVCAIALAFGFFGSMPLAGPISVMVVSRAIQKRYREAVRIAIGAALAEGIYAGAAFFGFTELLARHPIVVPVSHGVTALVLAGLGVRFAFWRPDDKRKGDEHKSGTAFVGFSLSAINPTLLVTWGAAVAFLYSKGLHVDSPLGAIPFGLSAAVGIAGWFALLVLLLRRLEGKFPARFLTWTVRVLGVALVGLGVWSGVQLVQWFRGDRGTPATPVASLCSGGADDGPRGGARHGRRDRDA